MEVIVKEIRQRQPENMDEIVFRLPLGVRGSLKSEKQNRLVFCQTVFVR